MESRLRFLPTQSARQVKTVKTKASAKRRVTVGHGTREEGYCELRPPKFVLDQTFRQKNFLLVRTFHYMSSARLIRGNILQRSGVSQTTRQSASTRSTTRKNSLFIPCSSLTSKNSFRASVESLNQFFAASMDTISSLDP